MNLALVIRSIVLIEMTQSLSSASVTGTCGRVNSVEQIGLPAGTRLTPSDNLVTKGEERVGLASEY